MELITKFSETVTEADQKQQLLEIMGQLLKLQGFAFELMEENAKLKRKIEETQRKKEHLEDCEPCELAPGVWAYRDKITTETVSTSAGAITRQYLCSNCFQSEKKSILKRADHDYRGVHWVCPSCGNDFIDYMQKKQRNNDIIRG
ncbi:MAG: hypothetical protein WCP20_11135 [Desulfuromonadales bacterium]